MYFFSQKRINPAILMLHQLNRAHRNATTALMARHQVQDIGNPILLFILSTGLEEQERGNAAIPSQKELAKLLHVSPATVANSLKSLERGGYVHKEPDPKDARRNQVSITEKGRQACIQCVQAFDDVDNQLLRGFSQPEQEQVLEYLQRMLENLREIGGDPALHDQCFPHAPPRCPFSKGKE